MLFARTLRPLPSSVQKIHHGTRSQLLSFHPLRTMSARESKPTVPTTAPAKWPAPENWPASKVRSTFIDYFVKQPGFEHTFWPSSGSIPFDDDTLLFANAVSGTFRACLSALSDDSCVHGLCAINVCGCSC